MFFVLDTRITVFTLLSKKVFHLNVSFFHCSTVLFMHYVSIKVICSYQEGSFWSSVLIFQDTSLGKFEMARYGRLLLKGGYYH